MHERMYLLVRNNDTTVSTITIMGTTPRSTGTTRTSRALFKCVQLCNKKI